MSTDFEARVCKSGWSEEYDSVPLKLRFNLLGGRTNNAELVNGAAAAPHEECKSRPHGVSDDHVEDGHLYAENATSMKLNSSSNTPNSHMGAKDVQLNNVVDSCLNPTSSDVPGSVDALLLGSLVEFDNAHLLHTKVKHETSCEFDDSLDDIVLSGRRRMLLLRKYLPSSGSHVQNHSFNGDVSKSSEIQPQVPDIDTQASGSVQDVPIVKNTSPHKDDSTSDGNQDPKIDTNATNNSLPFLPDEIAGPVSSERRASLASGESKFITVQESNVTNGDVLGNPVLPLFARVKDEPVDVLELCNEEKSNRQNFTGELVSVKGEMKSEPDLSELLGDELDHLPFIDRMKLAAARAPSLEVSQELEVLTKAVASDQVVGVDILESVEPISISRPWKRRKTATDSAEIALEEDAPGLLKVLMERGVSADEIKLYGEGESEDALDDSVNEDGFAELEAVISQLFSERQTFMKFPMLRCAKGEKASYCLSCLLSLVEQTRYLRQRKWPVEWGWCRDLQSFIFVFRRHNRIVLERPEYGFATYFFELLDSVPVEWQIKRLVTAMKLTNCGRITLIENRPLTVGEDLSEGEARVLAEYGWIPNTGLGTMLNYCDRVYHDRKQEKETSEWRSKIAKQLINGYNGGNIVSKNLPKQLLDNEGSDSETQSVEVKTEQ